ncbi:MAG: DUF1579 domain-containing protein [Phycisphaerales bacterium]
MRKILATIALASFCGSAAVTGLALTAARPAPQPEDGGMPQIADDHPLAHIWAKAMDEEASMEAWMRASALGPAHEWLGQFIGAWDVTMTINMGPEPMVTRGHTEYTWLMEGRYLQDNLTSDFMGMPMSGYGISGFDNNRNQFVGIWMDSFSTGISMMYGSLDPTGTILTQVGTMDEPTTGEVGKAYMAVTTIIDEDHFRFEMKEILYGEAMTVMTIEYTRAD